jgi:hypothetical protein
LLFHKNLMNQILERKNKLLETLKQGSFWWLLLAIVLALAFLGVMIAKMIRDDDTQGVYYGGTPEGYRKRMAEKMGGGGGGGVSTYGQGKPNVAPKAPGTTPKTGASSE